MKVNACRCLGHNGLLVGLDTACVAWYIAAHVAMPNRVPAVPELPSDLQRLQRRQDPMCPPIL